jgi:hypothetical protein
MISKETLNSMACVLNLVSHVERSCFLPRDKRNNLPVLSMQQSLHTMVYIPSLMLPSQACHRVVAVVLSISQMKELRHRLSNLLKVIVSGRSETQTQHYLPAPPVWALSEYHTTYTFSLFIELSNRLENKKAYPDYGWLGLWLKSDCVNTWL